MLVLSVVIRWKFFTANQNAQVRVIFFAGSGHGIYHTNVFTLTVNYGSNLSVANS